MEAPQLSPSFFRSDSVKTKREKPAGDEEVVEDGGAEAGAGVGAGAGDGAGVASGFLPKEKPPLPILPKAAGA